MYKTILVPLENSSADDAILEHVKMLARATDARLVLIHVADGHVARNQAQLNLADSQEISEDRNYLQKRAGELAAEGLNAGYLLACGDPADEILAAAERERCDLIAMATHGHRFVKDVLLGSVANSVRHRTHIPVLLVRSPN